MFGSSLNLGNYKDVYPQIAFNLGPVFTSPALRDISISPCFHITAFETTVYSADEKARQNHRDHYYHWNNFF
jgi:hypothetical protein